jgi:hypothetical protein
MVNVTIREYRDGKCRATVESLRFPSMIHAEEFVDEFFESFYGSGCLKATIEKVKEAAPEISFEELKDVPADFEEVVDDVEELFLEEVTE